MFDLRPVPSDSSSAPGGRHSRWRTTAWTALATLLVAILAVWSIQPPRPLPSDAPPEAFSGERAQVLLAELLHELPPHPVGSPAARQLERRITAAAARSGLELQVESHSLCAPACVEVRNLLLPLPGTDPSRPWVLVSTHYDSVWAGPGAGDAGAGVAAALELARALRHQPHPAGVLVLLNEGEEAGLYGAKAFMEASAWRERVGAVVNLEARGTEGAAYVFELVGSTPALASAYRGARRPSISSLYASIYAMLPNSTDVVVYTDAGLPAANIAFLGRGDRYHTPLDDLAHLDLRSLQHLGDHALAMTVGLAHADLDAVGVDTPGIVFDLLGLVVIHTPIAPAALLLFALAGLCAWRARPGLWVLLRLALILLASVGAAALVELAYSAAGARVDGWPSLTIAGTTAMSVAIGTAVRGEGDADEAARWAGGVALWFVAGGLGWLFFAPGGLYVPLISLVALAPAISMRSSAWLPLAALGGWGWWLLWAGLPSALGLFLPVVAATTTLATLVSLPGLSTPLPRSATLGVLGLALLCAGGLAPHASAERPRGWVVEHVTDGARGWVFAADATFPRGGPRWTTSGPASAAPIPLDAPAPEAPATGFLPATLRRGVDGGWTVEAPGGIELWVRVDRGQITRLNATEPGRRRARWLGDTAEVQLQVSDPDATLEVAVARPGVAPDVWTPSPAHVPIHTGYRTWSYQRLELAR